MHSRPRRHSLSFLATLAAILCSAAMASRSEAVCALSACDATALLGDPQCCTASTCTVDGTLTVNGPTCTFDFGTRNLTVSGQVLAQGKVVTLMAKSMKLTGLIDLRAANGGNAGNVTIVTTGMTALAFSQEGGTSAVINASSSVGKGGNVTIQADGAVSLAKGSITASGGGGGSGGIVSINTSAGSVTVQIAVTASSGIAAVTPAGQILVSAPGDLTVTGSGRFVADIGDIDVQVDGAASFAEGSLLQASSGGTITVVAGSLTAFGEFKAPGESGAVELRAVSGPMFLQRLSQGITVGPGVQSVSLSTEALGAAGLLTVDMPILANGAEVEIESTGSIVISKKIETTGITIDTEPSEAGDITIDAEDDVLITKAIVGADSFGDADLSIDGRDVTIEGNLDFRGGGETSGGRVDVTADRDLVLQGDIFVNVSGADFSDAGSIDMQAGGNFTIGPSVELIADGSPAGTGGGIFIVAGEGFGERLPGNVLIQGDVKANGHTTGVGGAFLVVRGCDVSIPAEAVLDVSGDAGSNILVSGRTNLTIAGQLKSTTANVLELPVGAVPSLTGSFTPARSAGLCTGGTATANGCERPVCTGPNVPANCLHACPTCGDDQTAFPETCDTGPGGAFCSGNDLCDARCRLKTCAAPNSCTIPFCDAETALCSFTVKADDAPCDTDNNVCTGVGTCLTGTCRPTPGTALQCDDQNPCTGPDTCNAVTGCTNPDRPDGPGVAGCDDGQFCTGVETCASGVCQSGALPCTPPQICDPIDEQCESPTGCDDPTDCPEDGNPCTDRVCSSNTCTHVAVGSGTPCDDNNVCNGVRTCNASGVCQQPSAPLECDDGNPCTTDTCDPIDGCEFSAPAPGCCTNAGQCGDGDACTIDSCSAGNTCEHTAIVCNDNDACTTDACNPQSGCTATAIPGCQPCVTSGTCSDDQDVCTDKVCLDGRCQQVPNPNCCQSNEDCEDIDSNPCTDNGSCNANRCGTSTPLLGEPCGTTCSPATCNAQAQCVPGVPLNCSDNNMCTADVCSDDKGCTHTPIMDCCLSVADCNDAKVCTTDICDDANLCVHPKPDPMCTDCLGGDPFECGPRCTTACQGGRCVDAVPNCDDNDVCTNDACDAATGCTHTPRTDLAECGNCTPAQCNDNDPCTTDACNETATACVHDPKTSYDALSCRLEAMKTALDAASADAVSAKLRRKTNATIAKLRAKIDKAKAAPKCKKARSLVGSVRGPLRKLQRSLNRSAGKQIDAGLATTLAGRAGEMLGKADEVRAGLGC